MNYVNAPLSADVLIMHVHDPRRCVSEDNTVLDLHITLHVMLDFLS